MFDLPNTDPRFDPERRIMKKSKIIGPLYALASNGKIKYWEAQIEEGDLLFFASIKYTFGYIDGKKQVQEKEITEGKNLGKTNETSPYEQACNDAKSKADKKRDQGYQEDKTTLSIPILPMLAHPFDKRKHNINWPAAMQPKIDGIRCTSTLENGKVKMFTRKGKDFTIMSHIESELQMLLERADTDNFYIDGELYSDELTFQELAGAVRRSKNEQETLDKIYLIVFDCFSTDNSTAGHNWSFTNRWKFLSDLYKQYPKTHIKLIETIVCNGENDLRMKHDEYIQDGYEGIMIRNINSNYKLGNRSADLQKLKSFKDKEFIVTDYKEGEGTELGCVVWQCKTSNASQKFWVRPVGNREERQDMFINGNKYLGKELTVRYQEFTDDGIPRFPVGVCFRNYEG